MEQKISQIWIRKYLKLCSRKYTKNGILGSPTIEKKMPYVGVRKQPTWQYFGSVAWATKLRPGKTWSGRIPMDASAPDHRQNGRPDPAKALSVKPRHPERQRTA